jgi:hypothetical protein
MKQKREYKYRKKRDRVQELGTKPFKNVEGVERVERVERVEKAEKV